MPYRPTASGRLVWRAVAMMVLLLAPMAEQVVAEVIADVRWIATPHKGHGVLVADRFDYDADDGPGQFLLTPPGGLPDRTNCAVRIEVRRVDDPTAAALATVDVQPPMQEALAFFVDAPALPAGRYAVTATFTNPAGERVSPLPAFEFTRSDRRGERALIPAEGIELNPTADIPLRNGQWPIRVGVPLPDHAVTDVSRLALFSDGKPIAANIVPVATWRPRGAIKWVHVAFMGHYRDGKPASYRLKLLDAPQQVTTTLRVSTSDKAITVDTGAVRFLIGTDRFRGIERAWLGDQLVIDGPGGPYLKDGRAIDFDGASDAEAQVTIEEHGPAAVTIKAVGRYTSPGRRAPSIGRFTTRMTAYAGSPMILISHQTTIDYDTRLYRIADLGFRIVAPAERFHIGADGSAHQGVLPTTRGRFGPPELRNDGRYNWYAQANMPLRTVFLHQDRDDRFRLIGATPEPVVGRRSDGWFGVTQARQSPDTPPVSMTVLLRDVWQKFPKELELSREVTTLHFWPKHGHRAFGLEEELDKAHIYKFRCFHQHSLMDLDLPNDYFDALRAIPDSYSETLPEHGLNGNGEGLTISNDFAILLSSSLMDEAMDTIEQAAVAAAVFQAPPSAPATPQWNCATGAMGPMAPAGTPGFREVEDAHEHGWLAWHRTVEHGSEYGMWIYANGHTYWNVAENRASVHRPWINSHYHQVGTNWMHFYRTGSKAMLDWARASTDHFINIGTIGYATREHDPFWNREQPRHRQHFPGAMYHCKAPTPWGGRTSWGMNNNDADAGLWGHWVDPDASLWAWYLDGNFRAKDMYDLWCESIGKWGGFLSGTKREINTSLAYSITYYQATWEPWILANIHGMARSLATAAPLETQGPGPMWHPLWVNRYFELTGDPSYVSFILKYGRFPGLENTWNLPLATLAYELSNDASYLTQHLPALARFSLGYFHKPGDPYDWYGLGPGPLGDGWTGMSWPAFAKALKAAGIEELTSSDAPGFYPLGRATVVYFTKPADRAVNLTFDGRNPANLHPVAIAVIAPDGAVVHKHAENPSRYRMVYPIAIPAEAPAGLYRFELGPNQGSMQQPLSDQDFEAQLLASGVPLTASGATGWLTAASADQPVQLRVAPLNPQKPGSFRIRDANGKLMTSGSVLQARGAGAVDLTLDPATHPQPWRLESGGEMLLTVLSEQPVLLSHRREAGLAIANLLRSDR